MTDAVEEFFFGAYDAYNNRDVDRLLEYVAEDVDWPNGEKRLHGHEEVRRYWLRQWAEIHTHDQPTTVTEQSDGRYKVHIEQIVRGLDGTEISRGSFEHLHVVSGGLITKMDIKKL